MKARDLNLPIMYGIQSVSKHSSQKVTSFKDSGLAFKK